MVARFQKAAASRPLLLFPIVQKRPIILPSKRRPLRARSCCYLLSSKRRPLRARSCCYLLPSKRRPLREKGGGHSCCSDPNCSQLLQNSRRRPLRGPTWDLRFPIFQKRLIILPSKRRPLRGPSWDLWFPIFQKRIIILPSKRRPLREKGGGHSCCSDPNCSQLLQNSRRRPLRGPSWDLWFPIFQKKTHYFALPCPK